MAGRVKTVAILSDVPRIYSCISNRFPSLKLLEVVPGGPGTLRVLKEAEVILADFDKIAEYLYQLNNSDIKWIQGTWAGIEPVMKQYDKIKTPPPFPVARFSGEHFGTIMSEYVVAQVTAFERDFKTSWEAQKEKKWDTRGNVKDYRAIRDMKVECDVSYQGKKEFGWIWGHRSLLHWLTINPVWEGELQDYPVM